MNQKGFYNENKEWSKKLKGFFKESGFYVLIVVGLCVLAVGAVYFTTNHLISPPEDERGELVQEPGDNKEIVILEDEPDPLEQSAIEQLQQPDRPWDYQTTTEPPVNEDDLTAQNPAADEPEVETITKPTVAPTKAPTKPQKAEAETGDDSKEVINLFGGKPSFKMPVEGKINMDYAMDKLLYSKTLDEWRVHTGIDIAAPRGEAVKAASDGYIKEIKEDPCYGITITLDHENGYKSIYSNLASSSMVSVNQKVKAGDAISSVGNTAIFECMDPPHLHYEVYKDDKLIDPKTLLPVPAE
ncbi:MAG: peptidoglycan DD-metalloendopeptidase family protein [Thermoclostridium sp.]|nr:peptidoglycan DD-metalloendopeptidase family protein [Thermoclostridium sp.]